MKEKTKKWLEDSVKYFKDMGFLKDGFCVEAMPEYFRNEYFDEYFKRQPKGDEWFPLDEIILSQDHKRVWWKDLEISHSTGWISPILISEINKLLIGCGIFLYLCDTGDQTTFIVALTKEEKRKLGKERGWKCYCAYDQE